MGNAISAQVIKELNIFDNVFSEPTDEEKRKYLKEYLERFDPHTFYESNDTYLPKTYIEQLLNLYTDKEKKMTKEDILQLLLSRLNLSPQKFEQNAFEMALINRMRDVLKKFPAYSSENEEAWEAFHDEKSFKCWKSKISDKVSDSQYYRLRESGPELVQYDKLYSIDLHLSPVDQDFRDNKPYLLLEKNLVVEFDYLESNVDNDDETKKRLKYLAKKNGTQIEIDCDRQNFAIKTDDITTNGWNSLKRTLNDVIEILE